MVVPHEVVFLISLRPAVTAYRVLLQSRKNFITCNSKYKHIAGYLQGIESACRKGMSQAPKFLLSIS